MPINVCAHNQPNNRGCCCFAPLQEKMKVRHRDGFRPPQRGKRSDVAGDAPKQRCAFGGCKCM